MPSLALELSEGRNNDEDDGNGELLTALIVFTGLSSSHTLQLIVLSQSVLQQLTIL